MNDQAIFEPMLATMTLTAAVWVYMYSRRILAMKKARAAIQTYASPGKIAVLRLRGFITELMVHIGAGTSGCNECRTLG